MSKLKNDKKEDSESVANAQLQKRVDAALAAYEKACKALSFQERLKLDALESLAESERLLR